MKITQQQIEAALNYADNTCTNKNAARLAEINIDEKRATITILAAAYREKCEEVEKMKAEMQSAYDQVTVAKYWNP